MPEDTTTMAPVEEVNDATPAGDDTPGPVPYDRFREVNEARQAAEERARDLESRALEQTGRMERVEQMLETRLPEQAPVQDDSVWEDPEEVMRRELRTLRERQEQTEKALRSKNAIESIDRAVDSKGFEDPADVKEYLSMRYMLAQSQNQRFDAEAEATTRLRVEQDRAVKRKQTWADEKKRVAEATVSAVSTSAPPTGDPVTQAPAWGDKAARAEWEKDQTKGILSRFFS